MIASVRGVNATASGCDSMYSVIAVTRWKLVLADSDQWLGLLLNQAHTIGGRKIVWFAYWRTAGRGRLSFEHGGFADGSSGDLVSDSDARLEGYFVNLRHRRTDHDSFWCAGCAKWQAKRLWSNGLWYDETCRGQGAGSLMWRM